MGDWWEQSLRSPGEHVLAVRRVGSQTCSPEHLQHLSCVKRLLASETSERLKYTSVTGGEEIRAPMLVALLPGKISLKTDDRFLPTAIIDLPLSQAGG